jgi:hypothetical protein
MASRVAWLIMSRRGGAIREKLHAPGRKAA